MVTAVGGVKKNKEPGVKACAFAIDIPRDYAEASYLTQLVIHVVNLQQKPSELSMQIEGKQFHNAEVKVLRTNKEVSIEPGKTLQLKDGKLTDQLAPLGMVTYEIQVKQ